MPRERIYLFDTTLRDGAQTNGVDFTLHDKRIIAEMLDDLGIDYVEGGYPGANPTDTEFFAKRGYVAKQRNSITVNGEWLANTTMQKTLGAEAPARGTP